MIPEECHDDTRVLLADLVGPGRAVLASLLAGIPGVALVGEVGEPEALDSTVRQTRPDVLVVDDRLLSSARADRATRMIVVGADDDPGFAARAERLGAIAWIPKERADALLPVLLARPTAFSRRD